MICLSRDSNPGRSADRLALYHCATTALPGGLLIGGGLDNEESVSKADRPTIQIHRTSENNEEYAKAKGVGYSSER